MYKLLLLFVFIGSNLFAQIQISIDAKSKIGKLSPYLFGKNNSFSSTNPTWSLSEDEFLRIKDSGLTFFRECGGNNATKYNWRRKLSSHPDWYNNVYSNDWDKTASTIQNKFPNAQTMFAFQLIGMAAKTNQHNFNDWSFNNSKWWEGVNQNLAGNGEPNTSGNKAKKEGDFSLYLENWNADSTTAILPYWKSKGLDLSKVTYWSMDNEPEIWNGTHDDLIPTQLSAEEFIQKYVAVAQKARALNPEIKLTGPVNANEWQWYNWTNGPILYRGRKMPWLEFFIVRIAEEEKRLGIKLLDVVDIHYYPGISKPQELVQIHRVFFDKDYLYPEANGVKNVNGTWDNSQNKEYIFGRINDWLSQNFGKEHKIGLALTELGFNNQNPNITAVVYGSILGEFIKNKVELFSPWSWDIGMWEVLHLFSKNTQSNILASESSNEALVSCYASVSDDTKIYNLSIINRSLDTKQTIKVSLKDFDYKNAKLSIQTLKNLGSNETFVSDTKNAKLKSETYFNGNEFTYEIDPLSISNFQITESQLEILGIEQEPFEDLIVYPNPTSYQLKLNRNKETEIEIYNLKGQRIEAGLITDSKGNCHLPTSLTKGAYIIKIKLENSKTIQRKIILE